ncbi:MAG: hypothetical protein SCH70_01040 [Candidatus Methanoperedens sp.]|nr:hypothetical protein [Candidatus Methanoperedens sp.]
MNLTPLILWRFAGAKPLTGYYYAIILESFTRPIAHHIRRDDTAPIPMDKPGAARIRDRSSA